MIIFLYILCFSKFEGKKLERVRERNRISERDGEKNGRMEGRGDRERRKERGKDLTSVDSLPPACNGQRSK